MSKPFRDNHVDIISMNAKENAPIEEIVNEFSDGEEKHVLQSPSSNITTSSKHRSSEVMLERNEGNMYTDLDDEDNEKYAISKIMDAVKMLKNETDLRPRITFLDFVGQNMYYAFHQIFLSPKSCFILVVDMTKNLYEKVDVFDSDEKCGSLFESWRYIGNYWSPKLCLDFLVEFLT